MTDKIQTVKKVMFYRADLETIVWDDNRDKRVRFVGGRFTTDDPHLIKKLDQLGYPRVSLDAESPPPIPNRPVKEVGDVKILPKGANEETELYKIKREAKLKGDKKTKVDLKSKGEQSGAGKSRRQITRREK